jgi:uncharacterized membrane protein
MSAMTHEVRNRRPLISAGMLLGIGLGGFVDGIVFHQILQSHSMLSAKVDRTSVVGLEINMFWDGMFHAATWLITALGLAMLWRAVQRRDVPLSTKTLLGSLLAGWGAFNLVEGIIDHHILHLHHVVESANHFLWDFGFLGVSVLLLLIGYALIRAGRNNSTTRSSMDMTPSSAT